MASVMGLGFAWNGQWKRCLSFLDISGHCGVQTEGSTGEATASLHVAFVAPPLCWATATRFPPPLLLRTLCKELRLADESHLLAHSPLPEADNEGLNTTDAGPTTSARMPLSTLSLKQHVSGCAGHRTTLGETKRLPRCRSPASSTVRLSRWDEGSICKIIN